MLRLNLLLVHAFLIVISAMSTHAQIPGNSDAKVITAKKFVLSSEDVAAGITGDMRVAILVDKFGNVKKSAVFVGPEYPCSGNHESRVRRIMAEAEDWVKAYKFAPALKNNNPVETELAITLELTEKTKVTDPDQPRTINAGQVNGKAKELPKPSYPLEARPERIGGSVVIKITVDVNGMVESAQVVSVL